MASSYNALRQNKQRNALRQYETTHLLAVDISASPYKVRLCLFLYGTRDMAYSERFEMRFDKDTLDAIDEWRQQAVGLPSRSEAVRRLVEIGLAGDRSAPHRISDGDKLSLILLTAIADKLKVNEIDTEFIRQTIYGGHFWALPWEMQGIFHGTTYSEDLANEVATILSMWSSLEHGWKELPAADRARVAKTVELYGKDLKFRGFDGNNETAHFSVARFMIDDMKRFKEFKGRDLNSHMPLVEGYRRMLVPYRKAMSAMMGASMTADQIIEVLNAR
jgi:uncharacterized protein YfbU (UPF0304 family)